MMDVDSGIARIAFAIGEPARARMLYCLMDGRARTSTELAMVAEVSPSTASDHLNRLRQEDLVNVQSQGRHRYYSLGGPEVASVLEGLGVLAGHRAAFASRTPDRLRTARTCYDHLAGVLGVRLHDRLAELGWLRTDAALSYEVTPVGMRSFETLGMDLHAASGLRRRFACACLDWSERKPHLAGAVGALLLQLLLRKRWMVREPDCRALSVTAAGKRELAKIFQLSVID